jgi:type IV secretory pathway TraG/TraD family ATPase VirD4
MIQDITVLCVSIAYYLCDYFLLHLHLSESPVITVLAYAVDFVLLCYVIAQIFQNKKGSHVLAAILMLPIFWGIKSLIRYIPSINFLSPIPDWIILLAPVGGYVYFILKKPIVTQKNKTDRKAFKASNENIGDFPIYITPNLVFKTKDRFTHTQVIGATGSGKTWLVFYPWIYQDIKNGAGVFIFDIKANMHENVEIAVTANKSNRDMDYYRFCLGDPKSHSYNPLAGDNANEIYNRVASALYYEKNGDPFYEKAQQAYLRAAIAVLKKQYGTITFNDLYQATLKPALYFKSICPKMGDDENAKFLLEKIKDPELTKKLEGLLNSLAKFVLPEWAGQINTRTPEIDVADIVVNNRVLLFQANSGEFSQDYKPLSILMLMHLTAEISKRYVTKPEIPFFIYLDEFYNVIYQDFPELINKAREANVGLIFGHQAFGDLEACGMGIKNSILSNSRNKVVMHIDDPATVEYFVNSWGTDEVANKQSSFAIRDGNTMEAGFQFKDANQFVVHPDHIKYLKLKEGFIKLETLEGKIIKKVDFTPFDFSKVKRHKLHIRHTVKAKPAASAIEPAVEEPAVSMKKKFSLKDITKSAPNDLKEALKEDIKDEPNDSKEKDDKKPE